MVAAADAKRWLMELFAYDVGEKQRLLRAATARGYGLPGAEFSRPYPGSSTTVQMQSTTQPAAPAASASPASPVSSTPSPPATDSGTAGPASSPGVGSVAKAVTAGLTALALAAGGVYAWTRTPAPVETPAAIAPAPTLAPQEYQVDWHVDLATGAMVVGQPKRIE